MTATMFIILVLSAPPLILAALRLFPHHNRQSFSQSPHLASSCVLLRINSRLYLFAKTPVGWTNSKKWKSLPNICKRIFGGNSNTRHPVIAHSTGVCFDSREQRDVVGERRRCSSMFFRIRIPIRCSSFRLFNKIGLVGASSTETLLRNSCQ